MTNRYYRRSKIGEARFRRLLRLFALDPTATDAAELTGLSVRSVNDIYLRVRERLAEAAERLSPFARGDVEVDESYFGPRRVRGRPGRGAGGKTIVFGVFKRGGRVYTEVVPDCSKRTLQRVIRGQVGLDAAIHSDGWGGYDGPVEVGYARHLRASHGAGDFARGRSHVNGIESFWGYAKRRLAKGHGVPGRTFYLHLKECEFRFNHRRGSVYRELLKLPRSHPL